MAESTAPREQAERLAELLAAEPRIDGVSITGWRFDVSSGWSLGFGLKDGQFGGPYQPPVASRGFGGSLYLRWSDGTCTRGGVDGGTLRDFDEQLADWRANAHLDADAADIQPPRVYPSVVTDSQDVHSLVEGDPAQLLEFLSRARRRLATEGFVRIDAESGASHSVRFVFSSRGLRFSYPQTAVGLQLAAEELYSRGYAKRRPPSDVELGELIDDVAETAASMRPQAPAPLGELPILLGPVLAANMLGTFLVGNLAGSSVINGRSAFTLDDFRHQKPVAREGFRLTIDSTLDLEGAASPLSAEGVPGGRAVLVEDGRLVRPVVDLKYAARTGYPPTPVPGGSPSFLVELPSTRVGADARAAMDLGLEVHSVLGLRTQDAVSGRYTLVAPQAIVIREGRRVGRAKISFGGSLFEHLFDPRTELLTFPHRLTRGMLVWASVERQA